MARCLMTIFGQQLTHGTHTCLTNIGLKWKKQSMLQLKRENLEATTTKKRKLADLCSEALKSQSMEISSTKKGKHCNSNSAGSKRSRSGSNQPEGLSIGEPEGVKKGKGKRKKEISKKTPKKKLQLDSPAMGTRSKMVQPAMSTSKRRLSL